ncbi:hypothetical protein BOX15_Mlig024061g1 [Macrostomum lignano]|uniref:Uncharacterized protein n=1 Tax=Macrostomum lignano TaxID=282301 RepID=A0A267F7B9_9PLAT|nr:hypothetical protein BOX15_Mlig024061g1 [Macrostomum lignano]
MTEPLESAPLGSPPRELTFVKASSPPFIQKINGEDYDVISIAVDIPGFGRPTDTFVFLGEGNFTFSNAFASRRESWQGVVPTTFDASEQSLKKTAKDWAGTLEANVKNATKEDMKNEMKYWMKTKPPQQRHLDATNLGDRAGLSSRLGIRRTQPSHCGSRVPGARASQEGRSTSSRLSCTAELLSRSTASCCCSGCASTKAKIRERTTHRHRMCTTTASCRAPAATTTTAWALTCSSWAR